MSQTQATPLARVAALLLALFIVGCNASVTGNEDDDEGNEVRVTVQAIGSDYLETNDGIRYEVTADTKYEGLSGLSDISVGDVVEIEFEEIPNSTNRRTLEIEADGADSG